MTDDGVMQRGQSKDHRPDLPQLQLMAAAAEPSGHLIACDVQAGQCAEDPLYARCSSGYEVSWGARDWAVYLQRTDNCRARNQVVGRVPVACG